MSVLDNYRRYLERKARQSAGVSGRMLDLQGQALLWTLPAVILAGLDYLINIVEPYRIALFIFTGAVFLTGFLFASYVMLVSGVKIDSGQVARDRRDDGIL
jgi:hypothetical protein